MRPSNPSRGFTLIELMIVVSIIGLLASLALPAFDQFLLRSKRAEIAMNVDAIRMSEMAYHAEWDVYTDCALAPTTVPGRVAVSFPATETTSLDWNILGWVPDGRVYGQYGVASGAQPGVFATVTVNGFGDLDGDGNLSNVRATEMLKAQLLTGSNVY